MLFRSLVLQLAAFFQAYFSLSLRHSSRMCFPSHSPMSISLSLGVSPTPSSPCFPHLSPSLPSPFTYYSPLDFLSLNLHLARAPSKRAVQIPTGINICPNVGNGLVLLQLISSRPYGKVVLCGDELERRVDRPSVEGRKSGTDHSGRLPFRTMT